VGVQLRAEFPKVADEPRTISVEKAAHLLGISRNAAYAAVARKEIPSLRIGRRLLIPRAALERLLQM
jgi:excisionase family DNA binding protein